MLLVSDFKSSNHLSYIFICTNSTFNYIDTSTVKLILFINFFIVFLSYNSLFLFCLLSYRSNLLNVFLILLEVLCRLFIFNVHKHFCFFLTLNTSYIFVPVFCEYIVNHFDTISICKALMIHSMFYNSAKMSIYG